MAKEAPATPSTMPSASVVSKLLTPNAQNAASPAITTVCMMMPVRRGFRWSDEHAVDDAQHRAGEHRRRDHQALLRGVEMQVFGDEDGERSEDHPDHEADVEIEERCDKRGQMPGAKKSAVHGRRLSIPALICAAGPWSGDEPPLARRSIRAASAARYGPPRRWSVASPTRPETGRRSLTQGACQLSLTRNQCVSAAVRQLAMAPSRRRAA